MFTLNSFGQKCTSKTAGESGTDLLLFSALKFRLLKFLSYLNVVTDKQINVAKIIVAKGA